MLLDPEMYKHKDHVLVPGLGSYQDDFTIFSPCSSEDSNGGLADDHPSFLEETQDSLSAGVSNALSPHAHAFHAVLTPRSLLYDHTKHPHPLHAVGQDNVMSSDESELSYEEDDDEDLHEVASLARYAVAKS